jgi:pilus assembly protein CpaE
VTTVNIGLIGSSDSQLQELLRAAGARVTTTTFDELATKQPAAQGLPDAVVVDVRSGSTLPAGVGLLRRQHPDIGVLLVARALDPVLLLEAMRAQVTEVVAEPLSESELATSLQRIVQSRGATEPGQVFGIVGAKGGVGTTTVAVNTATALGAVAKPGRTLLIDVHGTGGDSALFSGVTPKFSIADALENTHRLDRNLLGSMVVQIGPHADLLAAPEAPSVVSLEATRLGKLIDVAKHTYKYTLLDLSRSDSAVFETLEQLTRIFIVVNQDLATVRSATRLAEGLRRRYGREKISVLVSRGDRDSAIGHEDVERTVGASIAQTFPSDYRLALQALNNGRPIALDNHNDLSASFRKFAYALAGVRHSNNSTDKSKSSFFGRLTRG